MSDGRLRFLLRKWTATGHREDRLAYAAEARRSGNTNLIDYVRLAEIVEGTLARLRIANRAAIAVSKQSEIDRWSAIAERYEARHTLTLARLQRLHGCLTSQERTDLPKLSVVVGALVRHDAVGGLRQETRKAARRGKDPRLDPRALRAKRFMGMSTPEEDLRRCMYTTHHGVRCLLDVNPGALYCETHEAHGRGPRQRPTN